MTGIFQTLEIEAFRKGITPRTKESRDWFRRKAAQIRGINRKALTQEDLLTQETEGGVGHLYMFFYDPKTKEKLPYYDRFPLVILVGPAKGGFYGVNLHYLPPILRAKFLDALLDITTNKKYDDSTKFKMSYQLLKRSAKMRYFKPCFKHYLTEHVKGKLARVSAPEYEIAAFLPTADFVKAGKNQVWQDSRKML